MTDTPKIDLVLADLEKEIAVPEPFTVVLPKSQRITFKDPFGFRLSERKEILDLYDSTQRGEADDLDLLAKILNEADYKKYVAADLPIRTHEALVQRVMAHFQGNLGDSGNDRDSNS